MWPWFVSLCAHIGVTRRSLEVNFTYAMYIFQGFKLLFILSIWENVLLTFRLGSLGNIGIISVDILPVQNPFFLGKVPFFDLRSGVQT